MKAIGMDPPMSATEISARMSVVGGELAKYPLGAHPNGKALMAELSYLKASYDRCLTTGATLERFQAGEQ